MKRPPTMMEALLLFWDAGVYQVSPGALGSVMKVGAFIESEVGPLPSGCTWVDGWIVLTARPS